jgi:stage III sporulation protein AF
MEGIRQYIIQVAAASLFCGIVTTLTEKKSGVGSLIRLMAVVFMLLTTLSPLVKVRLTDISEIWDRIKISGELFVEEGSSQANNEMSTIIKEKTEAYILEKAESLGAEISVEVTVSGSQVPVPVGIRVSGDVSPYGRKMLKNWISDALGIPVEEQEWIE